MKKSEIEELKKQKDMLQLKIETAATIASKVLITMKAAYDTAWDVANPYEEDIDRCDASVLALRAFYILAKKQVKELGDFLTAQEAENAK